MCQGITDQAKLVEAELASLGLDDPIPEPEADDPEVTVATAEIPVEPDIPPENIGDPVGAEDPADEPDDTDREVLAKAAQAQARAIDQLGVAFESLYNHFKQARRATAVLAEAAERVASAAIEDDGEEGEDDGGEVSEEG